MDLIQEVAPHATGEMESGAGFRAEFVMVATAAALEVIRVVELHVPEQVGHDFLVGVVGFGWIKHPLGEHVLHALEGKRFAQIVKAGVHAAGCFRFDPQAVLGHTVVPGLGLGGERVWGGAG